MRILANLNVVGTLDLDSVANAGVDTDRFLVQDSNGVVRYRTGAEVASDIGASNLAASVLKHQVKLGEAIAKGQAVYVSSSDGTNMIVSKASNASEATSSKTLGLLNRGCIKRTGECYYRGFAGWSRYIYCSRWRPCMAWN